MGRKQRRKQNRTRSKGIAKVSLLTIGTILIVILGIGFISSRTHPPHPKKPMYPSVTVSKTKEIEKVAITNAPLSETQNFTYWLEMPSEVPAGTKVTMLFKVKNTSNQVQTFSHGSGGLKVVVTRQDGTKVYNSPNYLHFSDLYIRKLEPGEEYVITWNEWEQTDNNGTNVPPGIYIVQPRYLESELPTRQLTIVPAN